MLHLVRGPTMSGILNHQINSVSATLMHEMQTERSQCLNAMSATEDRLRRAFEITTPSVATTVTSTLTSESSANSVSQDAISLEVLKLLKEIQGNSSLPTSSGCDTRQKSERDTMNNRSILLDTRHMEPPRQTMQIQKTRPQR